VGAALGPTGRVVAGLAADGPAGFEVTNGRAGQERERCLRDRLRAAMVNSALPWPGGTIRLDLTGWGGGYGADAELAIVVAVLRAEGVAIGTASDRFRGAIRLDGRVSEGECCRAGTPPGPLQCHCARGSRRSRR